MVSEEQKEGKGRRRREGKSEGIYKIKEAGNGDGDGVGKAREEGRVGNLPPSSSCGHSPSCAPKFLCDTPSGFRLPFLKARSSARLVVGGGVYQGWRHSTFYHFTQLHLQRMHITCAASSVGSSNTRFSKSRTDCPSMCCTASESTRKDCNAVDRHETV